MRYARLPSFKRRFKSLPHGRQMRMNDAIGRLAQALETGKLTSGLGLQQLLHGFWEIRSGLSDRIVFCRTKDEIEFVACGTHEEIKRFLKHI